jgi:hypothetical protein
MDTSCAAHMTDECGTARWPQRGSATKLGVGRAFRLKRWEGETTHPCARQEAASRIQAAETRRNRQCRPGAVLSRQNSVRHGIDSPASHSRRAYGQGRCPRTARSLMSRHRVARQWATPWTGELDSAVGPTRPPAVRGGASLPAPPATANRARAESTAALQPPSLRISYARRLAYTPRRHGRRGGISGYSGVSARLRPRALIAG